MSCSSEIHVNDNTRFILTIEETCVAVDISIASVKTIYITKPSGAVLTKSALFVTTGADGQIYWDAVFGDLNEAGWYKIQAKVVIGQTYSSFIKSFRVFGNLT